MNFARIYKLAERILDDKATFYDFMKNELHDGTYYVVSHETKTPESPYESNFEFSEEYEHPNGSNGEFDYGVCDVTMDDDALYWENVRNRGCFTIYDVKRVEAQEGAIFVHHVDGMVEFSK
jgi:hypothetical protein